MSLQKTSFWFIALTLAAAIVAAADNPVVVVETNFGNIRVELLPSSLPIAVANFLEYVEDGFYEGTIFHRVKKGTMIQGGAFTPGLQQKKAREPIKNEAMNRVKNKKGSPGRRHQHGDRAVLHQYKGQSRLRPQRHRPAEVRLYRFR